MHKVDGDSTKVHSHVSMTCLADAECMSMMCHDDAADDAARWGENLVPPYSCGCVFLFHTDAVLNSINEGSHRSG